MTESNSGTVRRSTLSRILATLREDLPEPMTAEQVEKRLEWSKGKLSRIERNRWKRPNLHDIRDLLDLYGVTDEGERERIITLAREAKKRDWWNGRVSPEYGTHISLEQEAGEIDIVSSIVPGLLQTKDYARAVVAGGSAVEVSAEEIEERVEIRLKRQEVLRRPGNPVRLWVIMDEAVLMRRVGGPDVHRKQLRALLEVAKLARVTLQIVPFDVGAHPGVINGFSLLRAFSADHPDIASVEALTGQLLVEEPHEVEEYRVAFDHLRARALPPEASLQVIAAAAAE